MRIVYYVVLYVQKWFPQSVSRNDFTVFQPQICCGDSSVHLFFTITLTLTEVLRALEYNYIIDIGQI